MRLDARIEAISQEIAEIGQSEAHCRALRTIRKRRLDPTFLLNP